MLDKRLLGPYTVHTMNELPPTIGQDFLTYQTLRLRDLIFETLQCCEDRKIYESQKFALPYSELKCLMLFDGERYLTVKGIAQKLDVAKSRVTKIVNGLIGKGLVKQINDPGDGRIKLISLTPSGRIKSDEIDAFEREMHRKILMEIGPDERKNVLSYLELLRSAMEAVKGAIGVRS